MSGITYNYNYDNDGEVTEVLYSGERSGKITTVKDSKKRVSQQTNSFADGISLTYNYTYENYPDDRISKVSLVSRFTQTIAYNKLDRTSQINTKSNGAFSLTEKYTYLCPYRTVMESQYVGGVTYTIGTKTEEDNYEYDAGGNISSITTARGKTQYEYDGLNRLVQEVNNVTGKKYNYTYDAGGNILTKKITDLESGTVQDQLTYYYDSVYKDRLVKVNGQSISGYDLLGRPTDYLGTSLTWENGRVSKFVKSGKTTTCKYNANGIRTEKTYSGIIHKYYLEGNTIVRESVSGNDDYEMLFMYGQNGIVGFTYNNINYYYRKNLLGDIVAIYNESGTKLCEYAYDAWGNCTILTDTNGIGALNPFRYRGYYWDSEINLYYIKTRYYDPEKCRWINDDNLLLTVYLGLTTLGGLNLNAYCFDNPVNYVDYGGYFPRKNTDPNFQWHIDRDMDQFGQAMEHLQVIIRLHNKPIKYGIYRSNHHSREGARTDIPKWAKERLIKEGVPEDYFCDFSLVQLPHRQEGFGTDILPPYNESFPLPEIRPPHNESFPLPEIRPTHNESFPLPEDPGATILVIAVVAVVVLCVAAAFFTGGQSLWGLLLI